MKLKLSVLDQTPIRRGSNPTEALHESVELAKLADRLGYSRYWLSEHHNISTLAGAAPEILIARLASETKHIRFGSGGIMLPNHSTLKVAENFRLLEGLFPGRIDLGIGRAPGGDRITASLLNPTNKFHPQDYVQQIIDLKGFLGNRREAGTIHEKVVAIPVIDTAPALWMLTSSGESAYIAAHFGMALSFAQFINPVGGREAIQQYKMKFVPSEHLSKPQASVGIFVFCGDTEEKAAEVQAVMDYRLLNLGRGRMDESPSYASVKDNVYSPEELAHIKFNRQRMIIGTVETVKKKITYLANEMEVDEIIMSTFADRPEDRLRSYELLARTFDLSTRDEQIRNAVATPAFT